MSSLKDLCKGKPKDMDYLSPRDCAFREWRKIKDQLKKGFTCCPEWLQFEAFRDWYQVEAPKYKCGRITACVDVGYRKHFSPETTYFVEEKLVRLLQPRNATRPLGVVVLNGKFYSYIQLRGETSPMVKFETEVDAHMHSLGLFRAELVKITTEPQFDPLNQPLIDRWLNLMDHHLETRTLFYR